MRVRPPCIPCRLRRPADGAGGTAGIVAGSVPPGEGGQGDAGDEEGLSDCDNLVHRWTPVSGSTALPPPPLYISHTAKSQINTILMPLYLGQGHRRPGSKREDCMVSRCKKGGI